MDDGASPRQLTFGANYDHALTFSPRGDEVAFLSNHEPDPDANNNSDIFVVTTDAKIRSACRPNKLSVGTRSKKLMSSSTVMERCDSVPSS